MPEALSLDIVIVNWNTRDLLATCLSAVHLSVRTFERSNVQTFVVDNASSDGSPEMISQEYPWAELIQNAENVGFARANNQGIQAGRGRYVLLLNSDTEMHPGAVETLVAFLQANPGAGAAGARLLNADGSLQLSVQPMLTPEREFWRLTFLDRLLPRATYRQAAWDIATPRRVEVIKGACLLLRRAALDQVGPLDEQFFMYTEEVDLCYRLARAGWTLWYVPQAVVTHFGEASSRQVAQDMYMQLYRSKVQFYRKTGGELRARRFKMLLRLAYLPRLAVATALSPVDPSQRKPQRTYRRLLSELAAM